MGTSYQIESELSEKQIEADVASFFGYMTPFFGSRLKLFDVNEQVTGADKKTYDKGRAYYFQFKKPIGLASSSKLAIPLKPRKNESKLMGIRRFRQNNGLDDFPYSLAFALHGDNKTPIDELQHNVLYAYERPPQTRAMYICPRTLVMSEYEKMLSSPFWRRFWSSPFDRSRGQEVAGLYAASEIWHCPFLRGHVTVVPHTRVTCHDHYYSFSINGTDIAFHSPALVSREASRLSDFLSNEVRHFIETPDDVPSLVELAQSVYQQASATLPDQMSRPVPENSLEWLQKHGSLLLKKYSIRQLIIAGNGELLFDDQRERMS